MPKSAHAPSDSGRSGNTKWAADDVVTGARKYLDRVRETIDSFPYADFAEVARVLREARERESHIFTCGNGGSAATASHLACDLNYGIAASGGRRFVATCLCDSMPAVLALSNDYSFHDVFVQQLKGRLREGDILIAISGSGNSVNIVSAVEYAKANGGITIGFTGYCGNRLERLCDHGVHLAVDDMQVAEDLHLVVNHLMMRVMNEICREA